jgi:beta-glucanase (GH16 family)
MNQKLLTKIILIQFALISISFASCSKDDSTTAPKDSIPEIPGYTLVWNDEFDGQYINPNKWSWEINGDGGGNNELQYYTGSPNNSYVENGKLVIKAIKENYNGKEYTSARLRTLNKGDWLYGRIEVSAKVPAGRGTWPAIWMLSSDWSYGGWPESGEIDIMEHVGYDPNVIHGSIHTKAYNHIIGTQKSTALTIPNATYTFHTYAIEWFADHIDFYIDQYKYFTFNNENSGWEKWPFDKRFHLILNLAVGGNWGGVQGVDENAFPAQMEVDYVRVYKKN